MNWKRVLIGVLVALVLVIGGIFTYRMFFAQPADESGTEGVVATVAAGAAAEAVDRITVATAAGSVSAEGQVVPLRQARLAALGGGQVAEILAQEGATVAEGDPILRLDTADQELALTQAQAGLAQAQANLSTAEAGLKAAQTAVQAAEVGVESANVQLALVTAEPRPEEVAVQESSLAVAQARIGQASAAQGVVLEGSSAAQVQAAQADLAAAEAGAVPIGQRLSGLQAQENADADALAQAQRDYAAAQARIQAAQVALNEVQQGATQGQRQSASGGVAAASAQADAAQAQLDLLLAGSQPEQVAIAEAGVAQAQARLSQAQVGVQQAEAAVAQAKAAVTQAQAAVDTAQVALDDRTISAPFAGVVVDITTDTGEVVAAGVPLAVVADTSGWRVETTDLTELDVVGVAVGQSAQVRADALPDQTFSGTVVDIATVSQEVRGDVTYKVTIELDPAAMEAPLRWGMTVFATIDTEQE